MTRITRMQVALIATAASVLTSAMHAGMQAIFAQNYSSFGLVMGYVIGRVLGDVPLALICLAVVYGLLRLSGIQADGTSSSQSSK
jgi:hypothetical protein